jgi:A/G-specific adenine glycosylase
MTTRSEPQLAARPLQTRLLAWWSRCRRDLPWRPKGRRRADPFAVWVSEVMLQQTRVATVTGYYQRFLDRFPTVSALAAADLPAVLKAWEGLGYYCRARNLHAAARQVVADFAGRLPADPRELGRLPGVGPYTAAAIASIAFGRDVPVLDGNVTRVLARVFRLRVNPATAAARRRLLGWARSLIRPGKAGTINQALMDLGATVCTPGNPRCPVCPFRRHCQAFAHGEQDELPHKPRRKPIPHYDVAAAVIRRGGRILIDRRKPTGLLGGLWEFPGGKSRPGETLEDTVVREVREEVGLTVRPIAHVVTVRHAYSHFRITMYVFECRPEGGPARPIACDAVKWVRLGDLDDYAFPKANHRIIAALRNDR